ncbi:hypothetical protein PHYBLDRAFT_174173 [Phycomyces blakesleeanus NRRL 1555(-)]|uniref:Uncharacterized protein n=1 Tax=Phycomyces blakesleeanus (strain ATCC 8743b / DSM 1359 / FGSC 10004 / NBRC 33097 / NRRL 1555) TaxID=763407 RepID=A0A167K8F3_PHYB8|nr:hypothetical protein PHYBLDRAFT_174173 [Phycomyces blakesleeanus NRRL 1555(-)]OAD67477.1 hypothetical protein PHYBLDRAFT_174173 [Phycomyces blakesleeanus NRRL 1555(-)]|eukprot:XP_018285517.1 hypothetical protein PHYBLDRAFT_174173 [Phycomyces blakesleeanus NRRL 1555(-)]
MFITKCLLAAIPKATSTFIPKSIPKQTPNQIPKSLTTDELSSIFNIRTTIITVNDAFTLKAIKQTNPAEYRVAIVAGKKKLGKLAVWRKKGQKRIRAAIRATFPTHATQDSALLSILRSKISHHIYNT